MKPSAQSVTSRTASCPSLPGAQWQQDRHRLLLSPDGKLLKDSHVDRVINGKEGTAMQAFRNTLNDVELAAVITYERNALRKFQGRSDPARPDQGFALGGPA